MVLMAKRYGHFSVNYLRGAVESIGGNEIEAGYRAIAPAAENSPKSIALTHLINLVDAVGIEPTTCRLRADPRDLEYVCFQRSTEEQMELLEPLWRAIRRRIRRRTRQAEWW